MALIPDEAIYSSAEISHAAFKLYACYCAHRNNATLDSWPGNETVHGETGIGYAYISTLKGELIKAGWLGHSRHHKKGVVPLKGFVTATDKSPLSALADVEKVSTIERNEPLKVSTVESGPGDSFDSRKESFDNQNGSFDNRKRIDKASEPAKEPAEEPKNIHTLRPRGLSDLHPDRRADIADLHSHYCALVETVPLEPAVVRTLNRALGERGIAYCKKVVDGCALDDWPDRKINNTIAHIFANGERMERLRKIADLKKGNGNADGHGRETKHGGGSHDSARRVPRTGQGDGGGWQPKVRLGG